MDVFYGTRTLKGKKAHKRGKRENFKQRGKRLTKGGKGKISNRLTGIQKPPKAFGGLKNI